MVKYGNKWLSQSPKVQGNIFKCLVLNKSSFLKKCMAATNNYFDYGFICKLFFSLLGQKSVKNAHHNF